MIALRPYQEDCIGAIRAERARRVNGYQHGWIRKVLEEAVS